MKTSLCNLSPCFASLDSALSDYSSSRVVIAQLPYDATASYRSGTRDGPAAILKASSQLELFDEELLYEPARVGIATIDPLEPDVSGPERMIQSVYEYCLPHVQEGKFVVSLGGEHTVSIGCLDAQITYIGKDLHVLHLDAHADLRDNYQGSPYSHACVARRMLERCEVLSVGIRSFSLEEQNIIQQRALHPLTMRHIRESSNWIEEIVKRLGPRVYISLDLDCLDPAICPGVGTPEPGGFTWNELLQLLRTVFSKKEVVGADVVECLPLPGQHLSQYVAARLVYKLIGYRFEAKNGI